MPQMPLSQARVIDPVLTTVAQGYLPSEGFVGMELFPAVSVTQRGGKIMVFGREAEKVYTNIERAPGVNTKRVQFGYSANSFSLKDYSLEGLVPYEHLQETRTMPGVDLAANAIATVQGVIETRLEKEQADLALNAALYPTANKTALAGTAQWSDYSGVSSPVAVVETGKEAIRAAIGRRPNLAIVPAAVMAKLKLHPSIIDRIKYTGRDIPDTALLASLWGLARVLIAESIYLDDAGIAYDLWGKSVLLAYTGIAGAAARGAPTFGYTYRMSGYPLVEQPYSDRNAKSWMYPVTDVVSPVIARPEAAYLIQNAVA